ncbi:glycosyl transferase family 1 [Paraburkholderia sp. BL6669N2]|uniref:glycoside hydrolase family 99-like domain-containing protein n=1 Tax=Paraburkholderia sp. BL6669N2 TaxID=1938807 RepID=UPI000E372ABB|nr:glycoside hydrolase family 99-like domain-containing protein [Paraburkholderia sp. BL6669N2]REG61255.1 glycosyl transferase family 1 [Paraburkholderia sp. BL6669N2]
MSNNRLEEFRGEMPNSGVEPEQAAQPEQDLAWDGERYIPGMSTEIELEHMHRYMVARKLAVGMRVLDIACGEGYGSYALSSLAASVVGVDISEEAVRHAQAHYRHQALNLEFRVGSAAAIPLEDASVDLVVSFETIEHHDQHEAMIREIKRVLRPGGVLVISSPNKYEYSDVTGYANPWHVKELYLDEFESLLRSQFANIGMYGQRVVTGSVLSPLADETSHLRTLPAEDSAHAPELPGVARPLYFVAVASDGALPALDSSVYEAAQTVSANLGKVQDGRIECKLYWHVVSEDTWSERHAIGCYVLADDTERSVRLEIREPGAIVAVRGLRLDLSDRPCVMRLTSIQLLDAQGTVAWSWDGKPQSLAPVLGAYFLSSVEPASLVVTSDDPWFELPVPQETLARAAQGWVVVVRFAALGNVESVGDLLRETDLHMSALMHDIDVIADVGHSAEDATTDQLDHSATVARSASSTHGGLGNRWRAFDRAREAVAEAGRVQAETQARLAETQARLAELQHGIHDRDQRIAGLDREREVAAGQHSRLVTELRQRDAQARLHHEQLSRIVSSTSWKITKPYRFIGRLVKGGEQRATAVRSAAKMVYRLTPVSERFKRRAKGACFRFFPSFFAHTRAYRDWAELRARIRGAQVAVLAGPTGDSEPGSMAPMPQIDEANLVSQVLPVTAVSPSADYQAFPPVVPREVPVRAIAFYLPQYHPFAENDEWWGRGFTEWTNVTRAVPQFAGHYQPHLPGELGFYDLRIPDVQRRQVELAKAAGLGGFCFYFYWFGGKRLMEAPILQYLEHSEFDLPFCLCWANENWTRRWDGLDQELLISQHHSPEDDIAFIEHVSQYMRDPRYIRIGGRPYLMVYRPNLLPDAKATVKRWREWARENGLGELYLAYTQSFEKVDPRDYGFDAAVEFPPNNSQPPSRADSVTLINRDFAGHVLDWTHYAERSRTFEPPDYKLFRGVTPSWDNEARKPGKGTVFVGSTPKLYEEWLYTVAADTIRQIAAPDERLVFINAWNEWAEGAHLEPDRKYGYAWLQATNDALTRANAITSGRRVVVVSHDAHPHGAQFLALNLARTLATDFGVEIAIVLLGEGPLKAEFARWGTVHDLSRVDPEGDEARALAQRFVRNGFKAAICNTTVSGLFAGTLADAGLRCVALVHELQGMLSKYGLVRHAQQISEHAEAVVFPAASVQKSFEQLAPIPDGRTRLRPQGLYKRNQLRGDRERARSRLREKLHLPNGAKIVLGVGFADRRKGADIFARIGCELTTHLRDVYFVWVGHWDTQTRSDVQGLLEHHSAAARFIFPGLESDTDIYYAGADVLALTSREDPFPSVVLEALEVGVPVVAFEGATGATELLSRGCGLLAPTEDFSAFAGAVRDLLNTPDRAHQMGMTGARIIAEEFSFRHYLFDLLDLLGCGFRRTSVIVPNYNYARFVEERLESVLKQKYPIYELIVLDDCSTDDSVSVIKAKLANQSVDNRLILNESNSGSVFAQWKRGAEVARGDYIWIAEADDLALPDFLSAVMSGFSTDGTVLSYCESKQMTETGEVMSENYHDYVADISLSKWNEPYLNAGVTEIRDALAVKNTIPNVSAVVFRREELLNVLRKRFDEVCQYRVAGDWMVYLRVLEEGNVTFVPDALNLHRRHGSSVTIGGFGEAQLKEIRAIQLWVREKYGLDPFVVALADSYAQRLCSQFNLDEGLLKPLSPSASS